MISFLSKIIKLNNLNVVGILKKEEEETYYVLNISKKGNAIVINNTYEFDNFDSLVKTTDLKIPVLLVIDGKGVLNKEINFNVEADVNWHKNIDFNTIYYTSLKSTSSSFISFCRKNIADESISEFQKNGFQVLDTYIGSFLAALLYNSLNNQSIVSNDLILDFDNEKLIGYSKQIDSTKKINYTIGKENISNHFIPLYGVLIHFFLKQNEVSKTENENSNVEEIIYKKAFSLFGIFMLIGFLVSLLASYLLIQYYGSKNAALNLQSVYSNQSYQYVLELEKQKENKQRIVQESGLMSSKFLTYYGYEIVKIVPPEITINELNITPLEKQTKANKKMSFEPKTIVVKGETFQESSFNTWISRLKKINWIKNFEIIGLKKDKKNKSQFEIKITLKDV